MAIAVASETRAKERTRRPQFHSIYPSWFLLPAAVIFAVFFLLPTFASLFFSLTRWTLFDWNFIGLGNFEQFFREPYLFQGLVNTLIYGVATSGLKVVLGLLLGGHADLADHRARLSCAR